MLAFVAITTAVAGIATYVRLTRRYQPRLYKTDRVQRFSLALLVLAATALLIMSSIAACLRFDRIPGLAWLDVLNLILCVYVFVLGGLFGIGMVVAGFLGIRSSR